MKMCDFTLPEIKVFLAECNFTNDEQELFLLRTKDIPLERCAEQLEVSISTANRINQKMKGKVKRIEMYQSGLTQRIETD